MYLWLVWLNHNFEKDFTQTAFPEHPLSEQQVTQQVTGNLVTRETWLISTSLLAEKNWAGMGKLKSQKQG